MSHFKQTIIKSPFKGTILVFLLLFYAFSVSAADVESVRNGAWSDGSTWSTGQEPAATDIITIRHEVVANQMIYIQAPGKLTIEAGKKFSVTGDVDITGDVNIWGQFVVNGTLGNEGNFELKHGSNLMVNGHLENKDVFVNYGIMQITGRISNRFHGDFTQNGQVTLTGNLINQYSWTINGEVNMTGDLRNYSMMDGDGGRFTVCGDVTNYSSGIVLPVVYLCIKCDGRYTNDGEGGFILQCGPFPVEIEDFKAEDAGGNRVILTWKTQSESGSDKFEILRTTIALGETCTISACTAEEQYKVIGSVAAAGQSSTQRSYRFIDENPGNGINFYRIKTLDTDGHFNFSKTVDIVISPEKASLLAYPNPTQNLLNVRVTGVAGTSGKLVLYDLGGRRIWERQVSFSNNEMRFTINVYDFAAGAYILNYEYKGKQLSRKVVLAK